MKDHYNQDHAFHYKCYRPPLHELLFNRSLKDQKFKSVLDIGCGVGNSSIALTKYCESVMGYDPSKLMIRESKKHPKVIYTSELNQLTYDYDLIVFFGSLFYVDDDAFILYQNQLLKGGFLLCCDFEIIYQSILSKLEISGGKIEYDHTKNLSSIRHNSFELIYSESFEAEFGCKLDELIHLLLSENHIKSQLKKKYKSKNITSFLRADLVSFFDNNNILLQAKMYSSFYKKLV